MRFPFNPNKAAECAAQLLKLHGGRMERLRLVKVMYRVERESLHHRNRPVFGDFFACLPLGPVPENTYQLIKSEGEATREGVGKFLWAKCFANQGNDVCLANDPGDDNLSDSEIDLIRIVDKDYDGLGTPKVVDLSHLYPEWEDPRGSSGPLPIERILLALRKTEEEFDLVRRNAEEALALEHVHRVIRGE